MAQPPIDDEDDAAPPADGQPAGASDSNAPDADPDAPDAAPGKGMVPSGANDAALKKQYTLFLAKGHALIFSPKTFPIIVQKLKLGSQQDPVGTMASIVVMVISMLTQDPANQLPKELLLQAGTQFIESIAEISEKARAHVFTGQEKQAAAYRGADMYRVQLAKQGKIDPAQAQQEMEALKQSDQSGELQKAIPDAHSHFGQHVMRGGVPAAPPGGAAPAPAAANNNMPPKGRGMMVGA